MAATMTRHYNNVRSPIVFIESWCFVTMSRADRQRALCGTGFVVMADFSGNITRVRTGNDSGCRMGAATLVHRSWSVTDVNPGCRRLDAALAVTTHRSGVTVTASSIRWKGNGHRRWPRK
jgi:hypothetical protein